MSLTKHPGEQKFLAEVIGGEGGRMYKVHKVTVNFGDYTAAAVTEALDISAGFPPDIRIVSASIKVRVDFSGGSTSAAVMLLGDAGDPNELVTLVDVHDATAGTYYSENTGDGGAFTPLTFESTYVPLLDLTTTGDDVDQLTSGRCDVYFTYYEDDDPSVEVG